VKIWLLLAPPVVGLLGLPFATVMLAAAAAQTGGNQLTPGAVPAPYAHAVIEAAASCTGVSAPVLAAQLEAESGWNPRAVSPADARGMAQFLPATWAGYGIDAPAPYSGDGTADIWDPYDAIFSAAVYDCAVMGMVAAVPGDPTSLTLAAYNAGPYAVIRHGGIPPYQETQRYVSTILERAAEMSAGIVAAPPAGGMGAATAIAYAESKLGMPYLYGGTGPLYDCSGLTQAAWAMARVQLPRTSREQWYAGPRVTASDLQPGDLVFYAHDVTDPSSIHHVALYIGEGRMIESPHTGAFVRYAPVLPRSDYIGAIRPMALPAG
jgi:cell wall-associated NlpC family hydrolase